MPISNHHKSFRDLGVIWKKLIWSLPGGILSGHRDMEVWEDFLRFSVTKGVGTIFNNYQFWRWVSWHFCSPKTIIFFRFTCHPGYQSPSGLWNIFSNLNLNPFATIASWAGRRQHILPIRFPSCFSFWAQTKNLPWKKTSRSTKTCHFLRGQKKTRDPLLLHDSSPRTRRREPRPSFCPTLSFQLQELPFQEFFPPVCTWENPPQKVGKNPPFFEGKKLVKFVVFIYFFGREIGEVVHFFFPVCDHVRRCLWVNTHIHTSKQIFFLKTVLGYHFFLVFHWPESKTGKNEPRSSSPGRLFIAPPKLRPRWCQRRQCATPDGGNWGIGWSWAWKLFGMIFKKKSKAEICLRYRHLHLNLKMFVIFFGEDVSEKEKLKPIPITF